MANTHVITTEKPADIAPQTNAQIGLSACLLGHNVRHNGGHTRSQLCQGIFSKHFDFVTFCPEVAANFGIPRPAMRLVGNPNTPKLALSHSDTADLTEQLTQGFINKLPEFGRLDGYILMKNSPSCGLERVKVYQPNGYPHQTRTAGLFAQALKEHYPLMPIEEEGRLHDSRLLENFLVRIYAYKNFRQEVLHQPSMHKLIAFHSTYKYVLMAYDQENYRALGRLLGEEKKAPLNDLIHTYFSQFMETLSKLADKKNHTNALLHILGYLKDSVPSVARQHIIDVIYQYKNGFTPLSTPLTLLKHYLDQYGSKYIRAQRYLTPYPENLNPLNKYL